MALQSELDSVYSPMLKELLLYFFVAFSFISFEGNKLLAQEIRYSTKNFNIEKAYVVHPLELKEDWMPQMQNLEMPKPGSERERLMKTKEESRKMFPLKNKKTIKNEIQQTALPIIIGGFEANKYSGSVPNDNNLAISNDGKLVSVGNTTIRAYDIIKDTLLFTKSLSSFVLSMGFIGTNNSKYDPKAIYDPENDRFIVVLLNGNTPGYSKIILAFSTTNNPADSWNLYFLSGNPLNDNTWSDYPAIAITKDELFLTVNQIIPGQPWQTGFSQTLIWQIDKIDGFEGDSLLNAKLWKDIWFGDNPVRNLNPIGGGGKLNGPNIFFLSNRNFAIQNDTIFMVEITGTQKDSSSMLKIKSGISDVAYGVPPTARQSGGHTFDTNDGRILGGFLENNTIQFVSNTIDTSTGFSAVYHGIISNPEKNISIKGKTIGDSAMDLGYPNISYTGKQECDNEALITFNHSSPNTFSGFSGAYYSNNKYYSDILKIKEGDNYVNILSGIYERWGDYSGSQRKFNEPGKVWVVGSYGNSQKQNATWVAELQSPDSTIMSIAISNTRDASEYNYNDGYAVIEARGGNEPYSYSWSSGSTEEFAVDLKAGKYFVTVSDAFLCSFSDSVEISHPQPVSSLFPNPANEIVTINFSLESEAVILISLFDLEGRLVKDLWEDLAKEGRNIFTFSTQPLARGVYFLKIISGERKILTEKFVKN